LLVLKIIRKLGPMCPIYRNVHHNQVSRTTTR